MKNLKSTFFASLTLLVLFSCDESLQNVTPQKNEAYYKEELEKLLHTEFKTTNNSTEKDQKAIEFKTYQEAYNFFSTFNDHVETETDTIPAIQSINPEKTARVAASGTVYETYSAPISSTASFNYELIGSGTVTAIYTARGSALYAYTTNSSGVRIYTGRQITGASATAPTITYAGNYTVEAAGAPAMATGISGGSFKGSLQGNASIAGMTGSFAVNYSGYYNLIIQASPGGAYFVYSMSATLVH